MASLPRLARVHRGSSKVWLLTSLCAFACLGCKSTPAAVSVEPEPQPEPEPVFVEKPTVVQVQSCRARTPAGAPGLISAAAVWLAHISPRALAGSQLWSVFAPTFEAEPGFGSARTSIASCGVPIESFEHILIGGDEAGGYTAVLTAPGIGRPEIATCVAAVRQEGETQSIPLIESLPGDPSALTFTSGETQVFLFHPDMVVIVEGSMQNQLEALSRCSGPPAATTSLAPALASLDTDAPLWLAGRPPAGTFAELESSLNLDAGSIQHLSLSARLDPGLTVHGHIELVDPSAASTATDALNSLSSLLVAVAPPEFQPAVQQLRIESSGAAVELSSSLSSTELEQIRTLLPTP